MRRQDVALRMAYVNDLDLNASAPSDLDVLTITLSTKFIPIRVWLVNATANLATAELGLYTAAAAGGTAIVTPAAVGGLTAAGKYHPLVIASLSDPITAVELYPRLTVAAGTAGTADLVLEYLDLSNV